MRKRPPKKKRSGQPSVRLPLPKRSEKRHGDAKKFHRPREKERLRLEIETR